MVNNTLSFFLSSLDDLNDQTQIERRKRKETDKIKEKSKQKTNSQAKLTQKKKKETQVDAVDVHDNACTKPWLEMTDTKKGHEMTEKGPFVVRFRKPIAELEEKKKFYDNNSGVLTCLDNQP